MFDVIVKEERNEERRQKILSEVEKLLTGVTTSLDSRSREQFNSRFTNFKSFLFDINSTS